MGQKERNARPLGRVGETGPDAAQHELLDLVLALRLVLELRAKRLDLECRAEEALEVSQVLDAVAKLSGQLPTIALLISATAHKNGYIGPATVALPTSSPPSTSMSDTSHSNPRSTQPPRRISLRSSRAARIPRSSGLGGVQPSASGDSVGGGHEVVSDECRTCDVDEASRVMA